MNNSNYPNARRGNSIEYYGDGIDFKLEYSGKKSVSQILATRPGTYSPDPQYNRGGNRLYHADNLNVLALLAEDSGVCGQVKLVYIDPPFGTTMAFESRQQAYAYDDKLSGPEYVETLRERIALIHHIMSDDGSFYLHLDSRMAFYMKIIMDEIFGKNNCRNIITRKKVKP